jgi:hypothetical protein
MHNTLSFAEAAEQRAEPLAERTLMSMFNAHSTLSGCGCDGTGGGGGSGGGGSGGGGAVTLPTGK